MMYKKLQLIVFLCTIVCMNSYIALAGDTTDLQGAWLLNETSGVRSDETANSNNLTDNNTVTSTTGQFGNAAQFAVSNTEYLSITDASQTGLDITGDFAMGAWVYLNTPLDASRAVISKWTGTGNQRSYRMSVRGVDDVVFAFSSDGSTATNLISSATLNTEQWYHLVAIHDSSAQELSLYIDGSEDANSPVSHTTGGFNGTSPFEIGATDTGSTTMDGLIDDAFVFNRTISTAEISDIMNNGLQNFISPARTRVMIIGLAMPFLDYYHSVSNHRKKHGLNRPRWMRWIYD